MEKKLKSLSSKLQFIEIYSYPLNNYMLMELLCELVLLNSAF